MTITAEKLEEERKSLEERVDKASAELHALQGALDFCRYLEKQAQTESEEEEAAKWPA